MVRPADLAKKRKKLGRFDMFNGISSESHWQAHPQGLAESLREHFQRQGLRGLMEACLAAAGGED